ncbi:MAG: hypothetical protein K0V04_34420 [Deltaproteobacteria bacterium]|nr:hypothetical protein [Deltaproteobacteria bacterium]
MPKIAAQVIEALVPAADRVPVTDAAADTLKIFARDGSLWVGDGTRRAPLRRQATSVQRTRRGHDARGEPTLIAEFTYEYACLPEGERVELSVRSLLARLENAAAMKMHRAGEYQASAAGFARAAQLDPQRWVPWSNLACALALSGDPAAAVASLEPLIEREPLRAYHKVMSDPELASIRTHPTLVALRAPKPGNASLEGLTMAWSESKSLVALRRQEQSWGSCAFVEELLLMSTETNEQVLTLPLVDWGDTDPSCDDGDAVIEPRYRERVASRGAAAQRLLRDMGFSVAADLEVVSVESSTRHGRDLHTARFPKARLGLAIRDDEARVLRGNEVLGLRRDLWVDRIDHAGYDPDARVAFIGWTQDVAEGCDDRMPANGFELVVLDR